MPRAAVIFGGPSPEHDISILTGLQVARALGGAPCLYWSKTEDWYEVDGSLEAGDFSEGVPRKARPVRLLAGRGGGFVGEGGALRKERPLELGTAVICCHGAPGEDGSLQGALDLAHIPYAGPDAAGAALGMDKLAFGAVVAHAGLPVLPRVAAGAEDGWTPPFGGPWIVKPRFGGSSIGIETVEDPAAIPVLVRQSPHLAAGAVVEPYREGAEDIEVAVRTHPGVEQSAISKPVRTGGIYSYGEKYVGGEGMLSAPREMNPELPGGAAEVIRDAVVTVAALARVRGVARVDFLLADGEIYVNEINTIPGSLSRHLWADQVPFDRLLADMLEEADRRPTTHWTVAGADGSALRAAGSIEGKLG